MLRTIFEGGVLFLIPFVGFALYLVLQGVDPLQPQVWSRKALSSLTLLALSLCLAAILAIGIERKSEQGGFVPSHVDKDGRFVPGQFKP